MERSVFIIILTWNHLEDTTECLESVLKTDYPNYSIVVVDNASTDSSIEYIKENYSQVKIIQIPQNLGYAEGNNVGMRYALEQKADYIFILNNDTVIQPDTVKLLVEDLKRNPQALAVSPISYYYYDREKVYFAGGIINPDGSVGHSYDDHVFESFQTGWLNGCAMLIRASLLPKIGLFDKKFFNLFEDTDWSMRAKNEGYELRVNPKAVIYHKSAASFGGTKSPSYIYYYTRNHLLWIDRNFPRNIGRVFKRIQFKRHFLTLRNAVKILLGYSNSYKSIRQAYVDYFFGRFSCQYYRWFSKN